MPAPLTWTFFVRTGPGQAKELTVTVPVEVLHQWEGSQHTRLRRQEQYAVAKLALFRHLDEGTASGRIVISADEFAEVLAELDLR
jgi:hypothetical protein